MKNLYTLLLVSLFLPAVGWAETISQNTATASNLGLYGGEVRDVASDPNSDFIYVTTYSPNGFFVSADHGATWQGLDATVYDLGEPRGVELDEDGNVYLLISEGLYKSSDHGATLTAIGDIGQFGNNLIYHDGTLLVGRNDGAVSVSTNQGASFVTSAVIQTDSYVLSLAGSPTSNTFYSTLDDNNNATLYSSTDGGNNWTAANTDDIANRYTTIAVDPNNANHLMMLSYGEEVSPWQSYDNGITWDQFDVYANPSVITFDASGRIYIGASYSDDTGATWNQVTTETPANRVSNVWPDSSDDNRLYGSTFGAVAISTDRGDTWTDSNAGITAVTVRDVAQSTDKNTVWIATGAGLAHSSDFTAESPTWEFPINYDYYPEAIWMNPNDANNVVVGGYEAIYYTTDGGDSWNTASGWDSTYAVQQMEADPNNPNLLYAAGAISNMLDTITGTVMVSTDLGVTWTSLAIPDAAASQALAVAQDGSVYVGAGQLAINGEAATGIYKYDGSSWTRLADSPDEQMTSLVTDPADANVLYATASDFNSNQQSDGGVYKTTDGGVTWIKLSAVTTSGLDEASKYRVITIQNSTNTIYMAGTAIENSAGTIWKSTDGGATWGVYYTGLQSETFNTLLFDGLIAGNSRGAYDIKGKAGFTNKKTITKITSTLKDAATGKLLKHKKVTLWKKKHGDWVKIDTDRTNSQAKAIFKIKPKSTSRYQLRYTPTGSAAEEYTKSKSDTIKVKIE